LPRERCANTTINSNTAGSSSSVSRPDNSPEGSSNRNHKLSTITRDSANTQGSNNGSHHSSMAANSNASNSAKDLSDSNAHSNKATKKASSKHNKSGNKQEPNLVSATYRWRSLHNIVQKPTFRTNSSATSSVSNVRSTNNVRSNNNDVRILLLRLRPQTLHHT
jgi:inorganic triphosphatase YgiF